MEDDLFLMTFHFFCFFFSWLPRTSPVKISCIVQGFQINNKRVILEHKGAKLSAKIYGVPFQGALRKRRHVWISFRCLHLSETSPLSALLYCHLLFFIWKTEVSVQKKRKTLSAYQGKIVVKKYSAGYNISKVLISKWEHLGDLEGTCPAPVPLPFLVTRLVILCAIKWTIYNPSQPHPFYPILLKESTDTFPYISQLLFPVLQFFLSLLLEIFSSDT